MEEAPDIQSLKLVSEHLRASRVDESIRLLQELRNQSPRVPDYWLGEAGIYRAASRPDLAVAALKQARIFLPLNEEVAKLLREITNSEPVITVSAADYCRQNTNSIECELLPISRGASEIRRVFKLKNVIIEGSSGVALTQAHELISDSLLSRPFDSVKSEVFLDEATPDASKTVPGEWIVLYGPWSDGFFHWMTEWVPRLVLAEAYGFKGRIALRRPKPFQLESLALLGVSDDRICQIDEAVWSPETLWMPEQLYGGQLHELPILLDTIRDCYTSHVKDISGRGERIYIDRTNPNRPRRIVNQGELDAVLKKFGFVHCDMDNLSLTEQIAIMTKSSALVGPHGAGMIHSMFMNPQSLVVEIFAPTYVNPCILGFVHHLLHRYHMVVSPIWGQPYAHGDNIEAYIAGIEAALKSSLT